MLLLRNHGIQLHRDTLTFHVDMLGKIIATLRNDLVSAQIPHLEGDLLRLILADNLI